MKPQTEIADFRKVIELAVADGKSIMVGGHAVNFWALFYFPRIKSELRQFLPFTSKDLDFYGDIHLLDRLVKKFGGVKRMSQPHGPVTCWTRKSKPNTPASARVTLSEPAKVPV